MDEAQLNHEFAALNKRVDEWQRHFDTALQTRLNDGVAFQQAVDVVQDMQAAARHHDANNPIDETHRRFDQLCADYLLASREQQQIIRAVFDRRYHVRNLLNGYIGLVARRITSPDDANWLRIGLAAALIDDARTDARDLMIALGNLYLAAHHADIDPVPHFHAVAGHTTTEKTRDLLANFRQSTYFRESVTPHLKS